jgi:long-chain acyl-CoA synthetase
MLVQTQKSLGCPDGCGKGQLPETIPALVERMASTHPQDCCFYEWDGKRWHGTTHAQFLLDIRAFARSLASKGVRRGDRVGILGPPCYGWEVADKAVLYQGAVSVGLDDKSASADLAEIVRSANLAAVVVESVEHLDLFGDGLLATIPVVYVMNEGRTTSSVVPLVMREEIGCCGPAGEVPGPAARPDDLAVILFTSGTTGRPKGIPLSHRQLTAGIPLMQEALGEQVRGQHRTLAWVPLHNGTGRAMGTISYHFNAAQYFVREPSRLFDMISSVNPTYLVVVPRVLEKVHEKVQERLRMRAVPFRAAVWSLIELRRRVPSNLLRRGLDALLLGRLRRAVWGRDLRFLISGSAPVHSKILKFFDGMGIPTFEVYGLSEMSVVVSMNRPGKQRYGSVGQPLPGMAIKIAPDGELLVKSSTSLESYWGGERDGLFDDEGYLRTGDVAESRRGYLYITGRKKEIIKTSTGLRVSPTQVAQAYSDIPGVEHIVVVGDRRNYLTALVSVEEPFRIALERQGGCVQEYVEREMERRHDRLAPNRRVKRIKVLNHPLSIEAGEVTSSLKVRRSVVFEKHRSAIDALCAGDAG